jgi:uncharacterized membrane protein
MSTPSAPDRGAAKPLSPALDKTFKVGLVLKGLDGILEVAGGILLLFLTPHAIALLLAFIGYQLYQIIAVHFSVGLTALTVFDAALVWLTWREYQSKRARAPAPLAVPQLLPSVVIRDRPET